MSAIRLILADDHAIVRAGLRNALLELPEMSVVAEVGTGPDLVERDGVYAGLYRSANLD